MTTSRMPGAVPGLLSVLALVPVDAAPKGADMSCTSLAFLNACALNGGVISCSKGSTNGRADTTAMCCKDSADGRRVCSDDPKDIARAAVAPRAPNAGTRATIPGRNPGTSARIPGAQKANQ